MAERTLTRVAPVARPASRTAALLTCGLWRGSAGGHNWLMKPLHIQTPHSTLRGVLRLLHFPLGVMRNCVRWNAAYPQSLRNVEDMMTKRGVTVDPVTAHRWSHEMLSVLASVFCEHVLPGGLSWRFDQTYVLVSGQPQCLYRALDKPGTQWTFCSRPSETKPQRGESLSARSTCAMPRAPTRSASAVPPRAPCATWPPTGARFLSSLNPSICITSSNKALGQSSDEHFQCLTCSPTLHHRDHAIRFHLKT